MILGVSIMGLITDWKVKEIYLHSSFLHSTCIQHDNPSPPLCRVIFFTITAERKLLCKKKWRPKNSNSGLKRSNSEQIIFPFHFFHRRMHNEKGNTWVAVGEDTLRVLQSTQNTSEFNHISGWQATAAVSIKPRSLRSNWGISWKLRGSF